MKKVDLDIILKNDEIDKKIKSTGIFNEKNNILNYSDDNVEYTIDFNNKFMQRENDEFNMKLDFSNNNFGKITVFYKELSKQFIIDIFIKELKISTNIFSIKYIINDTENIEYYVEIIN